MLSAGQTTCNFTMKEYKDYCCYVPFVCFTGVLCCYCQEGDLTRYLLNTTRYSNKFRPVLDDNDTIEVKHSLILHRIVKVVSKALEVSLSGVISHQSPHVWSLRMANSTWLTYWLVGWLVNWLTSWLTVRLTDWLSDWLTDWWFDVMS